VKKSEIGTERGVYPVRTYDRPNMKFFQELPFQSCIVVEQVMSNKSLRLLPAGTGRARRYVECQYKSYGTPFGKSRMNSSDRSTFSMSVSVEARAERVSNHGTTVERRLLSPPFCSILASITLPLHCTTYLTSLPYIKH
jgi:hypothetical protein